MVVTIVFPLNNRTGSCKFPVEYANVQRAYADLSSQPVNSLCRPVGKKQQQQHRAVTSNFAVHWVLPTGASPLVVDVEVQ